MKKTFFDIVIKDNIEMIARSFMDMKVLAIVPIITVFIEGFKEYVFDDFQFLAFLFVLVFFDTVTKGWELIKNKTGFSFEYLTGKLFDKTLKYSAILTVSHVLDNFQVNGVTNDIFGYVSTFLFVILLVRESGSIFTNIGFSIGGKLKEAFELIKGFGNFSDDEKKDPPR